MQAQELPVIPGATQQMPAPAPGRSAIGRFSLATASFEEMYRIGKVIMQCGYYKEIRDEAQVCAKLIVGQELGLTMHEALTGQRMVEGKLEMTPHLMASRINRREGYKYEVEWIEAPEKDEEGDPIVTGCRIRYFRNDKEVGMSKFTLRDAVTAGLATKDNYRKYGRNMYFARAMSNGAKWYMPEVIGGGQAYIPGEISGTDFEPAPVRALAPVPAPVALPELPAGLVKAGDALGILPLGIHADLRKNGGDVTALLAQYAERAANKQERGGHAKQTQATPVPSAQTTPGTGTTTGTAQPLQGQGLTPIEQILKNDIDSFAPKREGPIPGSDDRLRKAQQRARIAFDTQLAKNVFATREDRLTFATWALGRKEALASFTELANVSECDVVMRALSKRLAEVSDAHVNNAAVACPACGAEPGDHHFAACELAA